MFWDFLFQIVRVESFRIGYNMTRFFLILTLLCSGVASNVLQATQSIEVRLSHNKIVKEKRSLYVDIEVRATERLILAGQNYRIYYPSDVVSIDVSASVSKLPESLYTPLRFSNEWEHIRAKESGQIAFDQDMGFINFYVELLDLQKGGNVIEGGDEWVKLATLKFDIKKDIQSLEMLWGRVGLSEDYATAFVQIAEWQESMVTADVEIQKHIDYKYEAQEDNSAMGYVVNVGPNPTSSELYITFDKVTERRFMIDIQDVTGRLIRSVELSPGSKVHTLDLSDLQSSAYFISLLDDEHQLVQSHKVIIAH